MVNCELHTSAHARTSQCCSCCCPQWTKATAINQQVKEYLTPMVCTLAGMQQPWQKRCPTLSQMGQSSSRDAHTHQTLHLSPCPAPRQPASRLCPPCAPSSPPPPPCHSPPGQPRRGESSGLKHLQTPGCCRDMHVGLQGHAQIPLHNEYVSTGRSAMAGNAVHNPIARHHLNTTI